ncbi:MAG: hypothetical protein R2728_14030 [Chitinophagales bacterium]
MQPLQKIVLSILIVDFKVVASDAADGDQYGEAVAVLEIEQ